MRLVTRRASRSIAVSARFSSSSGTPSPPVAAQYRTDAAMVEPESIGDVVETAKVNSTEWRAPTNPAQREYEAAGQWPGYSRTYLQPSEFQAARPSTHFANNVRATPGRDAGQAKWGPLLELVDKHYGTAADQLEVCEADPLRPSFEEDVAKAEAYLRDFESAVDAHYRDLHPTTKLVWDGMAVRRIFHLRDWIRLVRRQRERALMRVAEITGSHSTAEASMRIGEHVDDLLWHPGKGAHGVEYDDRLRTQHDAHQCSAALKRQRNR